MFIVKEISCCLFSLFHSTVSLYASLTYVFHSYTLRRPCFLNLLLLRPLRFHSYSFTVSATPSQNLFDEAIFLISSNDVSRTCYIFHLLYFLFHLFVHFFSNKNKQVNIVITYYFKILTVT